jgi:anti-anti-sigma factor
VNISEDVVGSVAVLKPMGAIVEEDAETFSSKLAKKIEGPGRVVVMLAEVPYMDSTGLEGLLEASDAMLQRNTQLKLVALTPTCREILELTALAGRFQIFESVDDAVRSFM